jgi:hypothetical protein
MPDREGIRISPTGTWRPDAFEKYDYWKRARLVKRASPPVNQRAKLSSADFNAINQHLVKDEIALLKIRLCRFFIFPLEKVILYVNAPFVSSLSHHWEDFR